MKSTYRGHEIETFVVAEGFAVLIDGKEEINPQPTEEAVVKNAHGLIDLFLSDTEDWKN